MGSFNARRSAKNFSEEDFAAALRYCHERGVRVFLTLNTLLSDRELPEALESARLASRLGVDAVLVQDWGLFALLREALPDCEILVTEELLQVALGDGLYDPAATAVDASGQNVRDLDGIERLTGLTQLDLSDNPGLDIAGLGQMTGLTELILSNCGLGDIGELSSLTRLLALDLGGNEDITDISALASLERLQTLDLSGTGVTDVSVLEGLPRLNTLILTGCEIEDLSVLEDFHGLDYLDLSDTGISRTELLWLSTALPGCTIYT